eukprot:TRINITY_DN7800_c0_g1_i4.p2 TRINITY_DN7800_c0_g1~~TRINITY_DN7800_c0_g1_i4.p2  ORF type:complete len:461 (+),score=96.62 TRINITY_DN7800_c0_g1_i4:507-1889(+)
MYYSCPAPPLSSKQRNDSQLQVTSSPMEDAKQQQQQEQLRGEEQNDSSIFNLHMLNDSDGGQALSGTPCAAVDNVQREAGETAQPVEEEALHFDNLFKDTPSASNEHSVDLAKLSASEENRSDSRVDKETAPSPSENDRVSPSQAPADAHETPDKASPGTVHLQQSYEQYPLMQGMPSYANYFPSGMPSIKQGCGSSPCVCSQPCYPLRQLCYSEDHRFVNPPYGFPDGLTKSELCCGNYGGERNQLNYYYPYAPPYFPHQNQASQFLNGQVLTQNISLAASEIPGKKEQKNYRNVSQAAPSAGQAYVFEAADPKDSLELIFVGIYDDVVTNKRAEALGGMIRVWNDARKHLYYDCVCRKRKPIKNLKAMISHAHRHQEENKKDESFICEICGRQFAHYLGLNSHQRVHKQFSITVPPNAPPPAMMHVLPPPPQPIFDGMGMIAPPHLPSMNGGARFQMH